MRNPDRMITMFSSKRSSIINARFIVRRNISTASFIRHRDLIKKYEGSAEEQGAVDCDFVSNNFLLSDKPLYNETSWWRRVVSGNNGSTHVSKQITSGRITEGDLIGAWEKYGQVKIKATGIAITPNSSLNGKGTRFSPESFHCINVIKIFDVGGAAYALSYDPEANCGISDVEKISSINPVCSELCGMSAEVIERIQAQCAMYRIDKISTLIRNADTIPESMGLYVAEIKPWLL